jgi:hypothetical protein
MNLPPDLLELAHLQQGVISRGQLLEAGVPPGLWRWNLGRHWRLILPGVALLSRGLPSTQQQRIGALLYAGPSATLAGAGAAQWHGITSADPRGRVVVLVRPPARTRRCGFVEVRRSGLHDPGVCGAGALRVSSPARAIVDAVADARTTDEAAAIAIEGVQRGIAGLDDLLDWALRRNRRGSRQVLAALEAAATGSWSLPEHELLALTSTSAALPEAMMNPVLVDPSRRRLTTPDLWYDDVAMAVMVHSRRYHSTAAQWDETVEQDGDLVAVGIVVVGVTPHRLRTDPAAVLRRVEAAYRGAQQRPRPAVVAARRHPTRSARRSAAPTAAPTRPQQAS